MSGSSSSKARPAATLAEIEALQAQIAALQEENQKLRTKPGTKRAWSKWSAVTMILADARTTDDDIIAAAARLGFSYKAPERFCRAVRAETAEFIAAAARAGWKG